MTMHVYLQLNNITDIKLLTFMDILYDLHV